MATASSSSKSKKQKRQVSLATFCRWQTEKEKEYQTLSWLRCDKANQSVELLWCASCRKFEDKIRGVKNFSAAWISGSANHKLSNVSDHARSDQHKLSMSLLRADEAKAMKELITTYAPIAKNILVMDRSLEEKMGKSLTYVTSLPRKTWLFENIQQSTS